MQAIRVHPSPSTPYSPTNPAPSTCLHLDQNIPIPQPKKPGDLLIRLKATTIVRDMLTWPETYAHDYAIIGNDLSGTVAEVFPPSDSSGSNSPFKPGDSVFGMAAADRGGAWAEYVLVKEDEIALKPHALTFAQAAAVPLSAQTAYEALFVHGGIAVPALSEDSTTTTNKKTTSPQGEITTRVLITGAAGAVGIYLVQLAAAARGVHVVAATSSNARNAEFLTGLGADQTVEYAELEGDGYRGAFDLVVDAVGGDVLAKCWGYVKGETSGGGGRLVSVDSASYEFVEEHRARGIAREGVKALFFIVQGSRGELHYLAEMAERGALRAFVVGESPFGEVREAYERANGRYLGHGKFVLTV
ncbi:hypothetical protein FE257_006070 [Aspergillus nanangensis]|uniref:Enoyl reductase (ER) domain-containing protein n=1 Tax=Aspergillus nanangensis TaxID=2582783 RepID=A0AAD4CRH6_ASPNN|nr:hypothetical protein FE257_006070 [Aspergillus nanangensis]